MSDQENRPHRSLGDLEAAAIVHRRWLMTVGLGCGFTIGIALTRSTPYELWNWFAIAGAVVTVLAVMRAGVWWYRLLGRIDDERERATILPERNPK